VYDDSFGSMAVRMWWLLRWLGHDAVALLDGGLPGWMRQKLPVKADVPEIAPTRFIPRLQNTLWVDASEVEQARHSENRLVLDARPEDRFSGEREPLDKIAGHIPGSINWTFEENLDFDGTYLPAEELREAYLKLLHGIAPEQAIHTCGSGVTACHNILAMEIAGLSGSKLYPGSWSEWIADPARPVATGE
jgi:thiosulfate/3-mercaptopyruvate sulfurtransferase